MQKVKQNKTDLNVLGPNPVKLRVKDPRWPEQHNTWLQGNLRQRTHAGTQL